MRYTAARIMPITYQIDLQAGLIVTIATGILINQELLEHKQRLSRDPDVRAGMVELSDVRDIDRLEITAEGVRQFAAHDGADAARFGTTGWRSSHLRPWCTGWPGCIR